MMVPPSLYEVCTSVLFLKEKRADMYLEMFLSGAMHFEMFLTLATYYTP